MGLEAKSLHGATVDGGVSTVVLSPHFRHYIHWGMGAKQQCTKEHLLGCSQALRNALTLHVPWVGFPENCHQQP